MKVFIIGIAGGVGRRVAERLLAGGDDVDGFVRHPAKRAELAARGIPSQVGDIVALSVDQLAGGLRGSDAVLFTAGAGGKDGDEATVRVDGDGPAKLAEAAARAGLRRFLLISVFPEAWRERSMPPDFERYMVEKKRAETELVRTDLDWLILRPSALTDDPGTGSVDLGLAKIHDRIPRDDVAAVTAELLRRPEPRKLILEVTAGTVPVAAAVAALPAA